MYKHIKRILFLLTYIVILVINVDIIEAQAYGLKFKGYQEVLDERTGLNLTPKGVLTYEGDFELRFDLKIDTNIDDVIFGYVFRLVNEDKLNVDLVSNVIAKDRLNLVIGNSNSVHVINEFTKYDNKWVDLSFKFILSQDKLVFSTPDSSYVYNNMGFKEKDSFKLFFGSNNYDEFKTTDVPSINIRDIKIFENGKLDCYWPLDNEDGFITKDVIKGKEAVSINPIWLKPTHRKWFKELDKDFKDYVVVAQDAENDDLIIIGTDTYTICSLRDNSINTYPYLNKPLFLIGNEMKDYRAVYSSNDNMLYCYTMDIGWPIYKLDLQTGKWNLEGTKEEKATDFRHHVRYYDKKNNKLYLFGGYGHFKYKNDIREIDLKTGEKNNLITNDSIFYPRYLGGAFQLNDTIYLMGGFGSKTGNQIINPHSFYDLIGFDINTKSMFKKHSLPKILDDMVVGTSMWVDPITRDYYGLINEKSLYEGYIQLLKGNLDKKESILVGDTIPFRFHDMRSNAELFYSKDQNKLFAYNTYFDEQGVTNLELYSISYPPYNRVDKKAVSEGHIPWKWFLVIVILISFGFFIYLIKKRYKVEIKKDTKEDISNSDAENIEVKIPEVVNETIVIEQNQKVETEKESFQVVLFGGFQVFDKDYNDITSKFTPILKELFLLILLNSYKNNKGVSVEEITEKLWYDKSEKSARNNRSVYIAKLRSILKELGDWELSKKTGYWKIIHGDNNFKCDYLQIQGITESIKNLTKEKILRIIQISELGAFLYNLKYDWLDEFKASISGEIIDALIEFGNNCIIEDDADLVVKIADCVFNFDLVNEDAMMLKCRAEYLMGKHSLAQATYDKFSKEYKFMYDQEYDVSFVDVLELKK